MGACQSVQRAAADSESSSLTDDHRKESPRWQQLWRSEALPGLETLPLSVVWHGPCSLLKGQPLRSMTALECYIWTSVEAPTEYARALSNRTPLCRASPLREHCIKVVVYTDGGPSAVEREYTYANVAFLRAEWEFWQTVHLGLAWPVRTLAEDAAERWQLLAHSVARPELATVGSGARLSYGVDSLVGCQEWPLREVAALECYVLEGGGLNGWRADSFRLVVRWRNGRSPFVCDRSSCLEARTNPLLLRLLGDWELLQTLHLGPPPPPIDPTAAPAAAAAAVSGTVVAPRWWYPWRLGGWRLPDLPLPPNL
jgi:hypothetical protein